MSAHHHHSHATGSSKTLVLALCLTTIFAVVEALGGWFGQSLALLSDAGHMLTDSLSLGIGALAAYLATKPASKALSFGFQRAEVLGALINAVLMVAVVAAIMVAGIERLIAPKEQVNGLAVAIIALLGLGINVLVAWLLMRGEQTLNVRGALLHVMGDLLGSVAALAAGLIIIFTGWTPIDPILSLLVAVLIGISAIRLLREVVQVLMEAVPAGIDSAEVNAAMAAVPSVVAVHDLHIWTVSSHQYALSAHIELVDLANWPQALPQLQTLLKERFAINHTTLQPEDSVQLCEQACN